jgi:ribonucleotide monophosphatase NagD (HAD superfamily)
MTGKPHRASFLRAENVLIGMRSKMLEMAGGSLERKEPPSRVCMIGDNPSLDIKGANEYRSPYGTKWESVLVATGVWKEGSSPLYEPAVKVRNAKEVVDWALRREGV